MIYTVAEVSEIVGLSKASIYNKINKKDLKEHLVKKQGVTYLDEIGLDLIKNDIKDFKDDIKVLNVKEIDRNELNIEETDSTIDDDVATDTEDSSIRTEYINYLKVENERLWSELKIKDEQMQSKDVQIQELNERLKEAHKLTENSQILLREKPQNILALEEHFSILDVKLESIKENMQERKNKYEQEQEQKGFLGRLFKR